jgi:hypothetical protein
MSAVLDSKLRKALELRTDSPAMLDALDSMSTFWSSNTLEAVRHMFPLSLAASPHLSTTQFEGAYVLTCSYAHAAQLF